MARLEMRARLGAQALAKSWAARVALPVDRQALAELLITAYRGTVDDGGETPEEALAEIDRTLGGAYGPYLEACSYLVEADGAVVAASLVTLWREEPLVAFVMVSPRYQGRGLGEYVLRRSIAAAWERGYAELVLYVTEGNAPAQRLYARLGFEVVEPLA